MKKDFTHNNNLCDSSIFRSRIKEVDLASQEMKMREIQGAAEELARRVIIDKLRQAEVKHEKLKLKLEQEACDGVEDILFHVELSSSENKNTSISGIGSLLAKLLKFFNFMDSELGVETDLQVYSMIKEREKKQVWIAAVIKFLRDKFNKLIKAIFSSDLSFRQKIDQEMEGLFKRLFENDLSEEEEAVILERLEAFRDLKLKLQIFAVGAIIAMFAELFSVELTVSPVETTKEKVSAKEANKEICENLEIKVEKEKSQFKYVVIPALDAGIWLKKPITLTEQELDLLPKPLKDMLPPMPNYNMNKWNSEGLKQEMKEVNDKGGNKRLIQPPRKSNVDAPATRALVKVLGAGEMRLYFKSYKESINFNTRRSNANVNGKNPESNNKQENIASSKRKLLHNDANSIDKKGNKPINDQKANSTYTKLAAKAAERDSREERTEVSTKHSCYPINTWVPSEITDVGIDNVKDRSVERNDEKIGMSRG